jgi:signal transduction histidine kinase
MNRSWISTIGVVGLALLIGVIGVLQYNWLSRASDADGEKLQKRLNGDTEHFAADFNREIQNAYFNFQLEPEKWAHRDWAEFAARYDYWRGKTQYPGLIKGFYFIENKPDAVPMRYDGERRTFETSEWPENLRELFPTIREDATFQPAHEDIPALVMSVYQPGDRVHWIMVRTAADGKEPNEMPKKSGYLVILLNGDTIRGQVLPDLAKKYFPDNDYRLSVTDKADNTVYETQGGAPVGDASAKLFELSPNDLIFFAGNDILPIRGPEKREVFVTRKVENRAVHSGTVNGNGDANVKVQIQRSGGPQDGIVERSGSPDPPHWLLKLQHRNGSLAGYVSATRSRNLAVSLGILSLLAAAVFLTFFSAQRAKRLARNQLDFVSSVSHEFRTPVAVIYSAAENLEDGVAIEPEQVSRYGNLIKGEGKKLSSMVEQILEFAGARSGRRKYSFSRTTVSDLIESAVSECRGLIGERGIELITEIEDGLPAISADKNALSQAIQNLIANSAKYCNGDKWVRIAAVNGSSSVLISVEDKGIGIAKGDLKQVFKPFFRARSVVDAQIHGNGLGLSLVRQIAEAHGGRATVESELGKGSKFTIELPS